MNNRIEVSDCLYDAVALVSALQAMQFDDLNDLSAHGVQLMLLALADRLEAVQALTA